MVGVEVKKLTKVQRVKKSIDLRCLNFDMEKDARSKSETKAREDFDKEYLSVSFDGKIEELMAGKYTVFVVVF